MTFAFGHLIGAWLLGKGYELYSKIKISHFTWFFLFLGGILPDGDFLLDWIIGMSVHRTFTHSFLFMLVAPLLLYVILGFFKKIKRKERRMFASALGVGIFTHILLDFFYLQGVPLFWPSPVYFSIFGIGLYDPSLAFLAGNSTVLLHKIKMMTLDMGLGVLWFLYLWVSSGFKKRKNSR